ncbi:hypothetical protein JCM10207_006608 [Rhodosporidiobolus poonsookiae]
MDSSNGPDVPTMSATQHDANYLMGPTQAAYQVQLLLFGVFLQQFFSYWSSGELSTHQRLGQVALWVSMVLNFAYTAICFYESYNSGVLQDRRWDTLSNSDVTWNALPVLCSFIAAMTEIFLSVRAGALIPSRRLRITFWVWIGCLSSLVLVGGAVLCADGVFYYNGTEESDLALSYNTGTAIFLWASAVADVSISCACAYGLRKRIAHFNEVTDNIIRRLVVIVFRTAAYTAFLSVIGAAINSAFSDDDLKGFVGLAFWVPMPALYALSLFTFSAGSRRTVENRLNGQSNAFAPAGTPRRSPGEAPSSTGRRGIVLRNYRDSTTGSVPSTPMQIQVERSSVVHVPPSRHAPSLESCPRSPLSSDCRWSAITRSSHASNLHARTFRTPYHLAARPHRSSTSRTLATGLSQEEQPVPTSSLFAPLDAFLPRHVGPNSHDTDRMLKAIGYDSLEAFVDDCVPKEIRLADSAVSSEGADGIRSLSEQELLRRARELGKKNKVMRNFIGMGYHQAVLPQVILRNMVENHGWFSQYSPYQAEISQGRLESLINFQTLTTSLTGLDIANASLLDEGTAAAEGMIMAFGHLREKRKTFFVDRSVAPQTVAVLQTRAAPFGIKVVIGNVQKLLSEDLGSKEEQKDLFGVLLQYPDIRGDIGSDWQAISDRTHELGGLVTVATDFLALTALKPPGEWGADIAFGNAARFGVPLGYGGPHAAFFACKDALKRRMPGRLIGLSKDAEGRPAYRLALQTREQHIRREKATSNICTAQALLANVSAMYAVYHGPEGLRQIAEKVHGLTRVVAAAVEKVFGHKVVNETYFDTLTIRLSGTAATVLHETAVMHGINLRRVNEQHVAITFDESHGLEDVVALLGIFSEIQTAPKSRQVPAFTAESLIAFADQIGVKAPRPTNTSLGAKSSGEGIPAIESAAIPSHLARTTPFLTQPVFNQHHSETDIIRYMHHLQDKDLSLVHAPIPLGSCTMKLNSTTSLTPFTWDEFAKIHPFAPTVQAQGYKEMMDELAHDLSKLTGLPGCSLQPNSGAQGEYAGLSVIQAYYRARGESHRHICLVPVSAHGTNPASAIMAGMRVVPVKVDSLGFLDFDDLKKQAEKHKDNLAAFMVTYPSTFGVFEGGVEKACDIIHEAGGQVYLDGANFNAMIGLTSQGQVGADVTHLNLHKTFSIPHGGGGPGVGPICVAEHLIPFLPGHPVVPTGGTEAIGPISAAPYGSASILSISWAYIKMLGAEGLKHSTRVALLNANYAMDRLKEHYQVKFVNENGRCAHEFLIDLAEFDDKAGIKVMDVAKRLQDYGIHPPTCSWPISTAMLIEPTESEGLRDVDRFCDAMISIRKEIQDVIDGKQPRGNNLITNAPHPQQVVIADTWDRPYSREEAAYPVPSLRHRKFWPTVARVDDAYGDKNLNCECGSVEEYV